MKSISEKMEEIQKETPHYLDEALLNLLIEFNNKITDQQDLDLRLLEKIKQIDPLIEKTTEYFQLKLKDSFCIYFLMNAKKENFGLTKTSFTPIAMNFVHFISDINFKVNKEIVCNPIDFDYFNKLNPRKKLCDLYSQKLGLDYRQKFNKEFEAEHFDLAKQVNPKIKRAS